MMPKLDLDRYRTHRALTFCLSPINKVSSPEAALRFVNTRGFVHFWPIAGIDFPSLWAAVAGDRPVADAHDDPGHITWGWKDQALGKRIWYYAKVLRRKATFISLEIAPYFFALSDNYGSPEEDYLISYEEGRLTQEAKQIFESLLIKGSLDTISLRREAHLLNVRESAFTRALEDLQRDFKILPMGIAEVGAWKYAYRYDLTSRHFPELSIQARDIPEANARMKLIELAFLSIGAAQLRDIGKLFMWPPELVKRTVRKLIDSGMIVETEYPQKAGVWLALPELVG